MKYIVYILLYFYASNIKGDIKRKMKWVFKTKRGYALALSEIRLSLCYGTIVISFPKKSPENFWIRVINYIF